MNRLDATTFPLTGEHLIEASAGTGKTYTITNLYLRLLLGRDELNPTPLTVDKILVLTFTIAATEELRDRIRGRINEARLAFGTGSKDPFLQWVVDSSEDKSRDLRLLAAAVQLMDEASIFTIHGFCSRVLTDNAFETGMLFDQALDADRDELLEDAARDCFRADILGLEELPRQLALASWSSPEQLATDIRPYLFRHSLQVLPPSSPVDEKDLVDRIRLAKDRWINEGFGDAILAPGTIFKMKSMVYTRAAAMTDFCASDELVHQDWGVWNPDAYQAAAKKGHVAPATDLPELLAAIDADQRQLRINLWHRVLKRVRENLERYKIEQSKLTLDDLLTQVHAAQRTPVGHKLSSALAERWPIALVDEFQDTDDIQWEIFSDIWQQHGRGLLLIGDPKQAIYQFRGADVFTYINAKRSIDSHYSLDTNWRSRPALVNAINTLFDADGLFGGDIPYQPVKASPNADELTISIAGNEVAPVSFFSIPKERGNMDQLRRLSMAHAAEEASRLLAGADGETLINGERLHAGQISILVRSRRDAKAAREALASRGIGSVYVTLESVFLTETADDLRLILHAVLEPTNLSALRAALATRMMQLTAVDIEQLGNDIAVQQDIFQEFSDYHRLWSEMDVATMINELMTRRQLAQKWYAQPDGERQLTNLRHLTELLQQRASVAPGMHRLFKWFSREKREADTVAADERQLRLASDRDLVKIVTMHASKGLQYEIVMIPIATFTPIPNRGPSLVHTEQDGRFSAVLHLDRNEDAKAAMSREQLDEDMRLLYVAVTRARHKCYIGIPLSKDASKSALGKLLDLGTGDLEARWAAPLFEHTTVGTVGCTPFSANRDTRALIEPDAMPGIQKAWRVHSYTGVSKRLGEKEDVVGATEHPGFSDDDQPADEEEQRGDTGRISRFAFPRGPRVGVALHSLMEDLDFQQPADAQPMLLENCLDRVGITEDRDAWTQSLARWVDDIRTAQIEGFSLADIPGSRRMDEMEFHFPVASAENVFDQLKSAGYLGERPVDIAPLHGLMTGMIDLVFEREGQFWIVDYKSNFLGHQPGDYAEAPLREAMKHHLYDLQYLIYSVALDRYLERRVPGYRFEKHFGGVAYLFLRGMRSEESTGVFLDKPDADVIANLSAALSARSAA